MIVKIHYTLPDGTEDNLVLSGSIEEIREQAALEVDARNGTNPWPEVLAE